MDTPTCTEKNVAEFLNKWLTQKNLASSQVKEAGTD